MKIRNGFVSNSSSSSFLILSKNNPLIPSEEDLENPIIIDVAVIGENYNRTRNEIVKTVSDKLRLITAFYAMAYNDWRNFDEELYINKMIEFKDRIYDLGRKYNYIICLITPPIFFSKDVDYGNEGNPINTERVVKEVNVSTEWWEGVRLIKDIVEDEDTTRLERLLFNNESFFIVGGDEYTENYSLQYRMKQEMKEHPFEHEFFGTSAEKYFGEYEPFEEEDEK